MLGAAKLLTFCCLALAAHTVRAQGPLGPIRGTLRENGAPIGDATVFLQSFDNEDCAKLFTKKNWNQRSVEKLRSCMHDVSTTTVDAAGNYRFTDLRTGWYAVHFLWNAGTKSKPFPTSTEEGRWRVMYAGHKDSTGKYDSMAQDRPLYFDATNEAIRDFERQR
jgi:hypothetical protein